MLAMLVLLLVVAASYVHSFTAVLPQRLLHSVVLSQQSTVKWMTTSKDDAASGSKKDPTEVVLEEYRDNLSNSRTAPGHHDGQEQKVKLSCVTQMLAVLLSSIDSSSNFSFAVV